MRRILNRDPRRCAALLILPLALGLVYAVTLAPDLTWANYGADGGDLVSAAATGAGAHPPGYPTYLLLAWLFQQLPLGSLAFRTNLLSAACATAAATTLAALVAQSAPGRARVRQSAGLLAGFALGLSPLLWSQAVITEVHALHALFVVLILWSAVRPGRDWAAGSLFGLALGNHLSSAFLLPFWLWASVRRGGWRALLRRLGWLLGGLLVYLTLIARARSGAPVGWGAADTPAGFWWLVSGQLYRNLPFAAQPALLPGRSRAWAALALAQFGVVGWALALFGLTRAHPRGVGSERMLRAGSLYAFLAYAVFALGYRAADAVVYLIPAFVAGALWLGWGSAALLARARKFAPLAIAGLLVFGFANALGNVVRVDASHDDRAVAFGRSIFDMAPPAALLISNEDAGTFTLWYFQYVLGQRPDIIVANASLLRFDWYRETLRRTYPGLIVPDQPTTAFWYIDLGVANPARPTCMTHIDAERQLVCPAPGLTQ